MSLTGLKSIAVSLFVSLSASAAYADSTQNAFAAFAQTCLGNDTNFTNWRETFKSYGVAEAGRLQNRLPSSYPSGDVVVYQGQYAKQTKAGAKRDCNVLLKGDQSKAATKYLKKRLRKFPCNKAKRSDMYYIPSDREKSHFDASYVLPNESETILIFVRTTTIGNAGLLTALNATVYPTP